MNRNLLYSLLLILIVIGLGYYAFLNSEKQSNENFNSLNLVPYNSTYFVSEIEFPMQTFDEIFNSNLIWKELISDIQFKEFKNFWVECDSIFSENKLVPEHLTFAACGNKENPNLFFSIKIKDDIEFEDLKFDKKWFVKPIKNQLVFSSSESVLTSVVKQVEDLNTILNDTGFNKIYSQKVKNKTAIFIKINEFNDVFDFGNQKVISKNSLGWGLFDVDLNPESFFLNGFINNSNIKEVKNEIDESFFNFIPKRFKEIIIFNYDTITDIYKDNTVLKTTSEICECDAYYHAYNWIDNQVVYFETDFNNLKYMALKVKSVKDFKESLSYFNTDSITLENNDSSAILSLNSVFNFSSILSTSVEYTHYIWWDDYMIFGESELALKRILFQIQSGEIVSNQEKVIEFYEGNKSHVAVFTKFNKGITLGGKNVDEGISLFQLFPENKDKVYSSLSYTKEIELEGQKTDVKWDLNFNNNLDNPIFVVKNHRTKDNEFLFQDENHVLFMVSPIGEIKWQKSIGKKIIGKIKNIDVLKNNKYQMVFNTSDKLFVVDVLGKNVDGFPVALTSSATSGVSVIDYDKKGNYRILIASNSGILSYNKTGNVVKGWSKPKQLGVVENSVRHLVIDNKDYLTVNDNLGKVYFYNRKGEVRHSVSSIFNGELNTISIGNTIETSSFIYLDTNSNSVVKQYFSNKEKRTLITPKDKIKQFYYKDIDLDKEKDYVLVSENELIVYGLDLVFKKRIPLGKEFKDLKIQNKYISYLNTFGELMLYSNSVDNTINLGVSTGYNISKFKGEERVLIQSDSTLRLIIK